MASECNGLAMGKGKEKRNKKKKEIEENKGEEKNGGINGVALGG